MSKKNDNVEEGLGAREMTEVFEDTDDVSEHFEPQSKGDARQSPTLCERLLSIQAAVTVLCLVAVLVVSGVTIGILSKLLTTAVSDTNSACDTAISEITGSCGGSLEDMAHYLVGFSSAVINKAIIQNIERGIITSDTLNTIVVDILATDNKMQLDFHKKLGPHMMQVAYSLGRQDLLEFPAPISAFGVYCREVGYAVAHYTYPRPPLLFISNGTTQWGYGNTAGDMVFHIGQYHVKVADVGGVQLARSGAMRVGDRKFGQLEQVGAFVGYPLVSLLRDPAKTASDARQESVIYVGLRGIESFLKSLGNFSSLTDQPSPTVYTMIRSSWLAEYHKAKGSVDWPRYDQSGILTGTSVGETTRRYRAINPATGMMGTLSDILPAVNATDPLIRGLAQFFHGRYESFIGRGISKIGVVVNETSDEVSTQYVGVYSIHNTNWGIDWWMVVAVDEDAVMMKVRETQAATAVATDASRMAVTKDIDKSKLRSTLITVGVSIVILVASVVLSHSIMAPIKAVQQAMNRVANMDLKDTKVTSFSRLYEARQMQRDFAAMVDCLEEYRAYVPSSLLNNDNGSVAKCVEPPAGNIAIVFTDIQGSTNLWKCSAEDMNVALEKHNELIRAACARHGGYEVKTIGDSFMISLQSPVAAAQLALDIQKAFAEEEWPERLELPGAGMVVRIGVNYGSTISESNPVTGRVDYRGSTVNMASRLEAKAMPGTTCISSDMYAALKPALAELGAVLFQEFGTHELKGLGEGHTLWLLVPTSMKDRLSKDTSNCIRCDTDYEGHSSSCSGSDISGSTNRRERHRMQQQKAVAKTGLKLQQNRMTVAVCKLSGDDTDVFDNCNTMVFVASDTATATEGVIGSVTGNTISVLWNASKKCRMHTIAGLSFAAQVQTRTQRGMRVGVATGSMLYGNVGTQKNRFATTFGTTFDAAEAVADLALRLHTFSMFADCTGGPRSAVDVSAESCLRLIDLWYDVAEKKPVRVYQLNCHLMRQKVGMWEEDDQKDVQRSRQQYAFITAFCRNPEDRAPLGEIRKLAEQNNDSILRVCVAVHLDRLTCHPIPQEMAGAFDTANPVAGCRCAVRFDRVPAGARLEFLGLDGAVA